MNNAALPILDPRTGNPGLIDLWRTVGILQVIFFHVIHGIVRFSPPEDLPGLVTRLPGWMNFGWQAYGVDIIFVVSAFLLTAALLREQSEFGALSLRRFYVGRLSRILPIYYLALILFALGQGNSWGEILGSALFIGYIVSDFNVIPVGWSMEVIILYYLALPWIVMALTRLGRPILWLSLAIIAAALARYAYLVSLPEDPARLFLTMIDTKQASEGGFALYFRPWFRLPAFLMGTLMAYLLAAGLAPRTWATPVIAIALIVAVVWLPVQDRDSAAYQVLSPTGWALYWAFAPVVFARAFGFLLIWSLRRGQTHPWRLPRWVSPFSRHIFVVYLFHMPMLAVAALAVFRTRDVSVLGSATPWQVLATFALTAALSLALALPITRYIERPAQNWLRRFG